MNAWTLVYEGFDPKKEACARRSAPWETAISPPAGRGRNPKRTRFITRGPISPEDTTA